VSRSDLVDNIDETIFFDRLLGQVVVTCYFYMLGAWLMHLFMVHVDNKLIYRLMHGLGYWYRLFGAG
jgi:hypothetical protein